MGFVYCKKCDKKYNEELLESEDGCLYCHVCGQEIEIDDSMDELWELDNE